MSELSDRLRAHYDDLATPVTVEEIVDPIAGQDRVTLIRPGRPSYTRRLIAAAAVVALIGCAAWLFSSLQEDASVLIVTDEVAPDPVPEPGTEDAADPIVADDVAPDQVITPTTWDLVVTLPHEVFVDPSPYTSVDEIVAALAEIDGITEVTVVDGSRAQWTALMGETAVNVGCDPTCENGLVIVAESVEALEKAAPVFYGWGWQVPTEEIKLSPEAAAGLAALGNTRIGYVADYVETTAGRVGPEPRFDTEFLGTEQTLVAADSLEMPLGPEEEPYQPQSLLVRVAGTEVGAFLRYPEPDLLRSTDAVGFELEPDGLDRDRQILELILTIFFPRQPGGEFGGGGVSVPFGFEMSADPVDGLGNYELVAEASWANGSAFGIGGLPASVAVVATELPDGTRLWQRPVSGIAVFALDRRVEFIGGAPPFTGYDAEGDQMFVNR